MLVVFDLDGTLIDSREALLAAHQIAWTEYGLPVPAARDILELVGLPLIDSMKRLNPDADAQRLARAYSAAYKTTSVAHECLFPGVDELLRLPFRAAVATGKSQAGAERAVVRHDLEGRFECVLGGSSVPRPKPYPDMLNWIRDKTGETDLVMIGDTTYDLQMAVSAGAHAIGVSWGHHSAARLSGFGPVADSINQLRDMLFEMGAIGQ